MFLLGSILGALLTSAAIAIAAGLLSPIPVSIRATVALCGLALLGLHQARVLCLDLPQREWQIPQETFHGDPRRAAARFALRLGTGVRTYITTAAPYGLALVLVLAPGGTTASALLGALLAAVGYGVGRSLIVLTQPVGSTIAVDHPRRWLDVAAWVSLAAASTVAIQLLGSA